MARKRKLPPYVSAFVDRHGKERYRFRRVGYAACYLPAPGTQEFNAAYQAAMANAVNLDRRVKPRSIDDLMIRHYRSGAFNRAGAVRRQRARGILESFRAEFGKHLVADFRFDHIETILQRRSIKRQEGKRMVGGLVAAENLRKELRRMFKLAVRLEWIATNPLDIAEGVKQQKGGFHTWTEDEIAAYRKRWEIGTKARAALEIMLWTWQRRGDAHTFGPSQVKGDRVRYTQGKTGKTLWLPAAPQMLAAIRALPAIGTTAFIVTEYGKPFSNAGFGNKMREWCDAAGLPHCTSHGLRKAAARRAADLGGTNQQLKAAGGWSNDSQVSLYTADADQAELSASIVEKMIEWDRQIV